MIKYGVRSCPLYLTSFTANFAVRASLRWGSNSRLGLIALTLPKRVARPVDPTTPVVGIAPDRRRNGTVTR
jgi:hypothetical protein